MSPTTTPTAPTPTAPSAPTPTAWPEPTVRTEPRQLAPGGNGHVVVTLTVPDSCHVQSHTPAEPFLIPTTLEVAVDGAEVGPAVYPTGTVDRFDWTPVELEVYRGTVAIAVPVTVAPGRDQPLRITGTLRYQGCTETTCLPPVTRPIDAPVPVAAPRSVVT